MVIAHEEDDHFNSKPVFRIRTKNKGEQIGKIFFLKSWLKWVFVGTEQCAFDVDQVKEVVDFMENEMPKLLETYASTSNQIQVPV